jgi:hypothetical protein
MRYFRQDDLTDITEQALHYMILGNSFVSTYALPVVQAFQRLLQWMSNYQDDTELVYICGRPHIKIDNDQLIYLVENYFRIEDIANIFSCFRRTIERRM